AAFGCDKTLDLKRNELCGGCSGSGAKSGTKPSTCPTCGGAGMVRQGQGFFVVQTQCPNCGGKGSVIADPCGSCHGNGFDNKKVTIKIKVPAGIEDGTRLRVGGEGEPSREGGPRGDLYVYVRVKPDPQFERHGNDVVNKLAVTYTQVALGSELEVPTLSGKAKLKVPAGTQPGEVLRMRGQGIDDGYGRRGDQLVVIDLHVPRKINSKHKELLKQLAGEEGEEILQQDEKGFFDRIKELFE
ncbi:MAG: molecular chaperone DnaJ, partial [Planctomycetota bacterium]|nr:molecular chaperone DnaJ [Planctomycetota bacterium]